MTRSFFWTGTEKPVKVPVMKLRDLLTTILGADGAEYALAHNVKICGPRADVDTGSACPYCGQAIHATASAWTYDDATTECGGEGEGSCAVYAAGGYAAVAAAASACSRESSRHGGPILTADSSRETLIAWLQWCDPNGIHTDEDAVREDQDPYTTAAAWQAVAMLLDV